MNYKKGDKVLIFIEDEKESQYESGINSKMKALNYHIAKITNVISSNRYSIDLDHGEWTWNSEMFLSLDYQLTIHSKVFGDITVNKILDDSDDEYPIEVTLKDVDIINLTRDFKYFADSENNIL